MGSVVALVSDLIISVRWINFWSTCDLQVSFKSKLSTCIFSVLSLVPFGTLTLTQARHRQGSPGPELDVGHFFKPYPTQLKTCQPNPEQPIQSSSLPNPTQSIICVPHIYLLTGSIASVHYEFFYCIPP
jgi:hypothetical protein